MADVRSLLRNERASRRITHPAASYSESGKLLCNVCVIQVKTESLWDNHIKSPQHSLRLQQAQTQTQAQAQAQAHSRDVPTQSKKRKAGGNEDEGRKRVKGVPDGFFDQADPEGNDGIPDAEQETVVPQIDAIITEGAPAAQATIAQPQLAPATPTAPTVDEEEWAAFERDMAAAQAPPPALASTAIIRAAPVTAEEIAAQAREEQSTQRDRRQAEIEFEKEDAEQALLDEFDEMEELEDRVRRLREKREALRKAREGDDEVLPDVVDAAPGALSSVPAPSNSDEKEQDDDDEEDDEDDFDDWNFGAT